MQGLMVVGFIVDEILRVGLKMTKSLEHEIQVKVSRSMWVPSRDIEEKPYARFDGCMLYSW